MIDSENDNLEDNEEENENDDEDENDEKFSYLDDDNDTMYTLFSKTTSVDKIKIDKVADYYELFVRMLNTDTSVLSVYRRMYRVSLKICILMNTSLCVPLGRVLGIDKNDTSVYRRYTLFAFIL